MEAARSKLKWLRPGSLLAVATCGRRLEIVFPSLCQRIGRVVAEGHRAGLQEGVQHVFFHSQVRLGIAADNHPSAGLDVRPNPVLDIAGNRRLGRRCIGGRLGRQDNEHIGTLEIGVGQVAGANEFAAQALDQHRQQPIAGQPARRDCARIGRAPIGCAVVIDHDSPVLQVRFDGRKRHCRCRHDQQACRPESPPLRHRI